MKTLEYRGFIIRYPPKNSWAGIYEKGKRRVHSLCENVEHAKERIDLWHQFSLV